MSDASRSRVLVVADDLAIRRGVAMNLRAEGYQVPTPIQAQAIPLLLAGHDLLRGNLGNRLRPLVPNVDDLHSRIS